VRSDNALVEVWIVQALDVVQVADIERCDVVAESEGKVCEFSVVGDVGVYGEVVARLGAEVEKKLCNTLLALGVLAKRVDDPDLTRSDGGGEGCGLFVSRDEFDVLDAGAVGDGDCADNFARAEFPQTKGVGLLDSSDACGLEDGDGDDEV